MMGERSGGRRWRCSGFMTMGAWFSGTFPGGGDGEVQSPSSGIDRARCVARRHGDVPGSRSMVFGKSRAADNNIDHARGRDQVTIECPLVVMANDRCQ